MPRARDPADPRDPRNSLVLQVPAAEPREAERHFLAQLALETDPSDVHADLAKGIAGFILADCRPAAAYAAGHIPGAASMPYKDLGPETRIDRDTVYVVYDDGLFDNAAAKACLRLSALGARVKEMAGGLHGWTAEGFPVARGTAPGKLPPSLARLR